MKGFGFISLAILLSALMLVGCQPDRGVQAGNDTVYQPRLAPTNGEMKGELLHVDAKGKTIGLRVESGMEQTFQYDENTDVEGLPAPPATNAKKPATASTITKDAVKSLAGREGSEIRVRWDTEDGAKMARDIEVTQLSTAKGIRRAKRQ